ncbi:MAG: Lrp/AsnC family transcriptional regulator [Kastovskya adunca ATA6-11-RM4]|nr:Lrp/AsnC family transcriptional regulator [Kastovskya adunca ATA6-11-RM4]
MQRCTVLIDRDAVGCSLIAFIAVALKTPADRVPFLQCVQKLSEVQECHQITGDDDYLLKVRCRNTEDLERVISDELKNLSGIVKTRTTIVLSTVKEVPRGSFPANDASDVSHEKRN